MSGAHFMRRGRRRAALRLCAPLALLGIAAISHVGAAGPDAYPTPGDYRIDSDTTTTSHAAGERLQHIDGATGHITVTLRDSLSKTAPVTQSYLGDGPNKWCVPTTGSPPPAITIAASCEVSGADAAKTSASTRSDCKGLKVEERWRRVNERAWERSIRSVQQPVAAASTSPRSAIEMATAGMSPEKRAAAANQLTGLPTAADNAAAMAPVIAALEAHARAANAQEAAMAREQLAMLRGSAPPDGVGSVVIESKERWTRVSSACRASR